MTLKLIKVRGQTDQYVFTYDNGTKLVSWSVNGNDVDTEILTDVVDTVYPASLSGTLEPTIPAIPLGAEDLSNWIHPGWNDAYVTPIKGATLDGSFIPDTASIATNQGLHAAEQAAREEEMRLRNGGAALARGIGMEDDGLPVVDTDRNDLGSVNWGV